TTSRRTVMSLADPTSDTTPFLSDESEAEGLEEPRAGHSQRQEEDEPASGVSSTRALFTVGVLCFINLLNYMDRFTVAGVLPDIEQYFGIDDGNSGLLQTVFICSYMFLAPVFGYLGDRHNRKLIMSVGIAFWSVVTLASSFTPKNCFWLLLLTRGLVGVGEASYSTIAPTIIADLYVKGERTRMLSVFYFAIPVGSGLGYIVGSKVDDVAGDWHWALRVTPVLGLIAVFLLLFVVKEPKRGAIEARPEHTLPRTSWLVDMKALGRNPSFMLSTFGFTAVAFVTGSLALWAPAFLFRASVFTGERAPCVNGPCDTSDSFYFGIITVVSGILGVASGAEVSRRLRVWTPRADPLVCAIGLLLSAPFLYLAIVFAQVSTIATYVFIFLGETFLSMNWAIVADILLYVVVPTRRSTAEAFQIVISHLLGDAGSPYLLGKVYSLRQKDSYLWQFRSLQLSLLTCSFVAVAGGAFFLATALFIERDRQRAMNYAPSDDEPIVVPNSGRSTRVPVSSVLI
uniref:Protein spinster homolog 1 n=1 Tax=Esox lucius TaxID=8010 RepID=A0A6Q2XYQ6_ESOLU